MAFLTFRGGVHPYDGKELSKEKPVRELLPEKNWYILCHSISALRRNRSWQKATMFWQVRRLQKWGDLFLQIFTLPCQEQ